MEVISEISELAGCLEVQNCVTSVLPQRESKIKEREERKRSKGKVSIRPIMWKAGRDSTVRVMLVRRARQNSILSGTTICPQDNKDR